jgi:hypothetical protein
LLVSVAGAEQIGDVSEDVLGGFSQDPERGSIDRPPKPAEPVAKTVPQPNPNPLVAQAQASSSPAPARAKPQEPAKAKRQEPPPPADCATKTRQGLWGAFSNQLPADVRHNVLQWKGVLAIGVVLIGLSIACFIFFLTTGRSK